MSRIFLDFVWVLSDFDDFGFELAEFEIHLSQIIFFVF